MYRQSLWQQRPAPTYRTFPVDRQRVADLFAKVRAAGRVELGEIEAREVIEAYGMRLPRSRLAQTPDEAVAIANEFGYPVVLKISSPDILHKSDIGGVRVGLHDATAVRDAFELIEYRARKYLPSARIWGILVQEMVRKGREILVGMTRDPQFGPLIAVGMGGIYVEVLKDVAFRLAPLSVEEVQEQIRSIRAYPLLRGVRGEPPADIAAIEETILRVSQMVTDFPENSRWILIHSSFITKARAQSSSMPGSSSTSGGNDGNTICRLDRNLCRQKCGMCRSAPSDAARRLPCWLYETGKCFGNPHARRSAR